MEILDTRLRTSVSVGFVAMTRAGKTVTLKKVLRETAKAFPNTRFFIYDPTMQLLQFRQEKGTIIHYEGSLDYKDCKIYMTSKDLLTMEKNFLKKRFHIVTGMIKIPEFIRTIYPIGGGTIVVDEIQKYYTDADAKARSMFAEQMDDIIQLGAHISGKYGGVSFIWTTKRIADMSKKQWSNVRDLFLLRVGYPEEQERIAKQLAINKTEKESFMTSLGKMKDLEFRRFEFTREYDGNNPYIIDGLNEPVILPKKEPLGKIVPIFLSFLLIFAGLSTILYFATPRNWTVSLTSGIMSVRDKLQNLFKKGKKE